MQKSRNLEKEYFSNRSGSKRIFAPEIDDKEPMKERKTDLIIFVWLKLRSPVQLDTEIL